MRVSGSARCRGESCRTIPLPPESDPDRGARPANGPSVDPSQCRLLSDRTYSRTKRPSPTRPPATRPLQSPGDWSEERVGTPRLSRPGRPLPSVLRGRSSYSMYPNPRSRFCISSFDVLLSSGRIFLVSFSRKWITNSSIDSYPAASEHCLTFSSRSPSIFTLCEPNMISPDRNSQRLTRLKHRLPHHILRFRDSEFRQNRGRDVGQRRRLRFNLAVAQQHSRHLRVVHAMIATPRIRVVPKHVRRKRAQNRFPSGAIPAVVADERIRTGAR